MIPRIHHGTHHGGGGGGGGTWTPEDLTFGSKDSFYSADTADNFTFSSGTNVSQWDDLSGNDYHLSVGGGTPTHDSTNKHVNFASGDYMQNTTSFIRDKHLTLVAGFRSNTSSTSAVASINTSGADWTMSYLDTGTSDYEFRLWRNNSGRKVETSSFNGSQDSGFNIFAVYIKDGGASLSEVADWDDLGANEGDTDARLNGDDVTLTVVGTTGGTYTSGEKRQIGDSDRVSAVFVGEVEFMLYINGTISLSNLEKVEGWWAHTFNHTSELPSDHTYKSSAP